MQTRKPFCRNYVTVKNYNTTESLISSSQYVRKTSFSLSVLNIYHINLNRKVLILGTGSYAFLVFRIRDPVLFWPLDPHPIFMRAWWHFFSLLFDCCCWVQDPAWIKISVAGPGCLSRIPDPDFYLSRIPDPKTATKERGEKSFLSYLFM